MEFKPGGDFSVNAEDLRSLMVVGRALWANPLDLRNASIDAITAVSFLNLTPDHAVEKAARTLLDRGLRGERATDAFAPGVSVFYRLMPEQRLLLMALHFGRWSYARLGRVLKLSSDQIEELAWSSRIALVSASGATYPSGAPVAVSHCPVYHSRHPWTQRFLDEELVSGRERLYLQNHMMVCDSCRKALERCRDFYYAIEAELPSESENQVDQDILVELEKVMRSARGWRQPSTRTFIESLGLFFQRKDILCAAGFLLGLVFWKILGHLKGF